MWWWWFVFGVVAVFLLLSGGGYYGYRRSLYGGTMATGIVIFLFVLLWIIIVFSGPHWDQHSW